MSALLWLAVPVVITVIAVMVLSWRGRERAINPHDGVEERRRFNEALKRSEAGPVAGAPKGAEPGDGSAASDRTPDA